MYSEATSSTGISLSTVMTTASYVGICATMAKAGESWWKYLIPFYGQWTLAKLVNRDDLVAYLYAGIIVVPLVGMIIAAWGIMAETQVLAITGLLIVLVSSFVTVAVHYVICRDAARCFGMSYAFTFGLLFLPGVFWNILAFGNTTYMPPVE